MRSQPKNIFSVYILATELTMAILNSRTNRLNNICDLSGNFYFRYMMN